MAPGPDLEVSPQPLTAAGRSRCAALQQFACQRHSLRLGCKEWTKQQQRGYCRHNPVRRLSRQLLGSDYFEHHNLINQRPDQHTAAKLHHPSLFALVGSCCGAHRGWHLAYRGRVACNFSPHDAEHCNKCNQSSIWCCDLCPAHGALACTTVRPQQELCLCTAHGVITRTSVQSASAAVTSSQVEPAVSKRAALAVLRRTACLAKAEAACGEAAYRTQHNRRKHHVCKQATDRLALHPVQDIVKRWGTAENRLEHAGNWPASVQVGHNQQLPGIQEVVATCKHLTQ